MASGNIINTYDQCVAAGGDRIVLFYDKNEYGRASRPARFSVGRIIDGKKIVTDPHAHWQDNGWKVFHVDWGQSRRVGDFNERKRQALKEAVEWVTKKYGRREFVRNCLGDYVERSVNEEFPILRTKKEVQSEVRP